MDVQQVDKRAEMGVGGRGRKKEEVQVEAGRAQVDRVS
jgi:hypothetical protein